MAQLTDAMKQMIATQQCFIGTVSTDGLPNVAPKRSTRVLNDETLLFAEGTARQTYTNLVNGSRVAIAVVNRDELDGYRFVGTATVHHSGPVYDQVAAASIQAGRPAPKAAVTVAVEEIFSLKPGPTAGTRIG
ncbi:MAG TPA: pyridoxamine 5'-phosphate oxidase family protein [Symbiobacteriaceae bacterium]|nr:pyridoxamine 5'-phosphate oxidase family protein [Symbiobacteriaceae bacterium]